MTMEDRNSEDIRAMTEALAESAAGQVRMGAVMEQIADGQRLIVTATEEIVKVRAELARAQFRIQENDA